jgi:hypothetical protein
MRKFRRLYVGLGVGLSALSAIAPNTLAAQQRVVTPNDGTWASDLRGSGGFAQITGTKPRNGNGSLELHTSGLFEDWGWFNLYAGNPLTSSFGLLSDLSLLSFDWMRGNDNFGQNSPVWQAQSVAVRLYVRSGVGATSSFSELVWEHYYTNGSAVPRDTWITEDATNQFFWRFVDNEGYTLTDCSNHIAIPSGAPLQTGTTDQWSSGNLCYPPGDLTVYGLGIGVGSAWPLPFTGYADNVQLAFGQNLVVNDNFELRNNSVTPEPASLMLIATGLAGLGGFVRRRRKR